MGVMKTRGVHPERGIASGAIERKLLLLPASARVRRSHDFYPRRVEGDMTASRGWWVHGALARLQVLLGGMVICHIRFSTTPDTMVVV